MSASSKYAALPFMALETQDVFESEDLPEADQVGIQPSLYDASVEIIPSGTVEAYQKFSNATEHLKNEKESNESFVGKLNRIRNEIDELKCLAKDNDYENFVSDVDNLSVKLENLQDIRFKKFDASKLANSINNVEQSSDAPLVTYELFHKPNKDQVLELSKLNSLEQRIKKIEAILGMNEVSSEYNFLTNKYLKDQSVVNVIIQLSNKVLQLDHSSLDRVDARLHVISEKLNQISEKKSCLENLDKENKLNELYNYYIKIDEKRNMLPNIVERLQVLNDVQEQASQFSTTLNSMKSLHDEIKTSLDKNSQNLKIIKELFENKSENIKKIIDDFNERLDKLKN